MNKLALNFTLCVIIRGTPKIAAFKFAKWNVYYHDRYSFNNIIGFLQEH